MFPWTNELRFKFVQKTPVEIGDLILYPKSDNEHVSTARKNPQ